MKRENYISYDDLFMGIAKLASERSKDPRSQHGACIVNSETNRIISVGYNGLVKGLSDDGYKEEDYPPIFGERIDYWDKELKQDYVSHAEENAIFNANVDLKGSILYLYSERGYPPCSKCARAIVQNEIMSVVVNTLDKTPTNHYDWKATFHIFEMNDIKIRILNT